MNANTITIRAPAKINLTLEVLHKRPDGYHEIRSVVQTISLCDTLSFAPAEEIKISSDMPAWRGELSLVSKAVNLVQTASGCSAGVRINVMKRIPLLSGLGGDSSDAAATLRGLTQLWHLTISDSDLLNLASELGSDVPFFLRGGTSLLQGRGEKIRSLPTLPDIWLVLVVPSVTREPGKTGKMYQSLRPEHYTSGSFTQELLDVMRSGEKIAPSLLFNTFENTAFATGSDLNVYRQHLLKVGATNVHLAGSGPALFCLENDREHASELYRRLREQNMECYLVQSLAEIEK